MAGQLLTLPMRVSMRATQMMLRASLAMSARALKLTSDVIKLATSDGSAKRSDDLVRAARRPTFSSTEAPAAAASPELTTSRSQAVVEADQPAHVSEEPVLVQEFAESGAEEGAGASVAMDEPWDGYDELTAKQIVARVRDTDAAALAAVELYESANRSRQTVLAAVRRQLRKNNGST